VRKNTITGCQCQCAFDLISEILARITTFLWYCAASYAPSTGDIAALRSSNPAQRHCSLLRLLHAAKRGRADPNCASSWVKAGAVRAITASIAAAPVDEAAQQVTTPISVEGSSNAVHTAILRLGHALALLSLCTVNRATLALFPGHPQVAHSSRALLALLNDAHAGAHATEQFVAAAADALHQAGPGPPSLALCQLLVSALELPITCMVGTVYSNTKVEAKVP
jgi:hypothetical protein